MNNIERSNKIQEHELIEFKVDQKVKVKDDLLNICGGKPILGYISSIILDANGIQYEIIYGESADAFPNKTRKLPGFLLEAR